MGCRAALLEEFSGGGVEVEGNNAQLYDVNSANQGLNKDHIEQMKLDGKVGGQATNGAGRAGRRAGGWAGGRFWVCTF